MRKEKTMIYITGNHTYTSNYHEGKKGYVDKFEKSVKIPFLSVLHNHLPNNKTALTDELEADESDFAVSDNVELSSAVTGSSVVSDSDADGTPSGSADNSAGA